MSKKAFSKLPFATLILGITLSFLIFFVVSEREIQSLEYKFKSEARDRIGLIEVNLLETRHILDSLQAFYNASNYVSKQEFQIFTSNQVKQYPYIKALEWIPKIEYDNKDEFEERANKYKYYNVSNFKLVEKAQDNKLVPVKERPMYFPVYYVTPYEGNELAFGYDLFSEESRKESLLFAAHSGKMSVTKAITLVQSVGSSNIDKKAILALMPIFNKPGDVVANSDLDNLKGFVSAVIDMHLFAEQILASKSYLKLGFIIFDISDDLDDYQIVSHSGVSEDRLLLKDYNELYVDSKYSIGGRTWLIRVFGGKYFNIGNSYLSLLILTLCLMLTFTVFLHLRGKE